MAKVEIEIPDDLLHQIDRVAERIGETRDAFLGRIAQEEIDRSDAQLRRELEQLIGSPRPMGGNAAQMIREERDRHPRGHEKG